ncbi:Protein CBG24207 [Caenorhabditis briggsae]|uniref:Protein CBG24207 n=2 Tax=Caenorhabditis briggsae TaxID=6238 RepID=A8WK77_CAEBR|nr:Protein CBG24207 [Caenorhabditis briggsae]ULT86914.1 hypothetical protein L3Y34_006567 [Caenorhabditis briggsae]CAP20870.2 Protein CBG24207 [Caenorhabditis briggsae]
MAQNFTLADFHQFDNSTKEALVIFGNDILLVSQYFDKLNFLLASIGVFINAFHIVILSRKSIISNVINVILLGIAISDTMNLSVLAQKLFTLISKTFQDECTLPNSSLVTQLLFYLAVIKDDFRRLSTWLGVLMAALRYLIIKNSLNPNFNFLSKPSSGWNTLAIAFIISTLMSMFYLIRVDLSSEVWVPPETCGYQTNFRILKYSYTSNNLFISGAEIYKTYIVFDGILKIIPAIVLPVLAVLLIRELKIAEVSRKKNSVVSRTANHADSTSKMVIIMTITCIFAEGPMGISFVLEGLVADVPKLRKIVNCLESILFIFVILNATTHFFVCLGVSTPYGKAVKELLGYKESQKPITISPKISSASIVTTRKVDARIDG